MVNTKIIKEYIVTIATTEQFSIFKEIDKIKYVPIDSEFIKKELFMARLWKRRSKKKGKLETRRVFEFQEAGLWVPQEYIDAGGPIPSTACKLSCFSVIIEIISDLKDENILRYSILYMGEHPWSEEFIKTYL